jgi:hypothetical protein
MASQMLSSSFRGIGSMRLVVEREKRIIFGASWGMLRCTLIGKTL